MQKGRRFNSQPPEGGWMSAIKESGQTVLFQLTAARRRLGDRNRAASQVQVFQLTAARRRLGPLPRISAPLWLFQLTAARRRLVILHDIKSRDGFCFNSQPPEGGWCRR